MPALGMAQDWGTVLRWLRSEGDVVERGEPLIEVETDKATVEIEAPSAGTLAGIRAGEGDRVPVGDVVAVVLGEGEDIAAAAPVAAAPAPAAAPPTPAPAPVPAPGNRRRLASPKARRMAAELAVDLDRIDGSGPGGAVLAADVERHGARPPAATGNLWRLMAERTTASWQTAPHFYLRRQVDAGRLESWRAVARSRPGGERLSHTDLLVRVLAEAARRHPGVNATWRDGGVQLEPEIGVGIAVATGDGLVVPVIRSADTLTLAEITARRLELVERARAGRLGPADLMGGTLTLSNLGMYGVDSFDAILNAPQAAILAVGRIADRVVAVHGAAAVRPVLELSMSFDHRVVDGARGAEFLQTLAALLEEPAGLVA